LSIHTAVGQHADDAPDVLDDAGLNTLGRFVQDQQLRRSRERPRNRELLLLPARQVAAAAMQHLLEHREQLKQLGRYRCAGRLVGQTHRQVFLHREPREDFAALGHEADTGAGALIRRGILNRLAVQLDAAGLDRHQAHQAFEQRRFADPIAPQNDRDLAQRGLQTHIAQDVRAAVILVDVLNF